MGTALLPIMRQGQLLDVCPLAIVGFGPVSDSLHPLGLWDAITFELPSHLPAALSQGPRLIPPHVPSLQALGCLRAHPWTSPVSAHGRRHLISRLHTAALQSTLIYVYVWDPLFEPPMHVQLLWDRSPCML